jgi:aminoglycoside 6'-N-acetyltransferase I
MIIRPVEKSDSSEWIRLRRLLWPDTSMEDHEAEISAYFRHREGGLSWVAEAENNKLIGFLEASIRPQAEDCDTRNVGNIEGWYVEPNFRRLGVGSGLVCHAEEWARSQGCKEMASDCDFNNQVSWKVHRALGFQDTSRLIHFRKKL